MSIHLDIGLTHPMQVNRKWICKEFVNIDTVHTRFCVFMTVVHHFQMTWCTESKASFFMCDKWPLSSLSHGQCYGKPTAIYTLSGVTFDLFQDGGRKWWRLHPTPQGSFKNFNWFVFCRCFDARKTVWWSRQAIFVYRCWLPPPQSSDIPCGIVCMVCLWLWLCDPVSWSCRARSECALYETVIACNCIIG